MGRRIDADSLICSLGHCECDGHTVHKLSQRRLTTDWLALQESDCSRVCSKVFSDCLPSYIKATRRVLQIFKMAGYFPDRPRIVVIYLFTELFYTLMKNKHFWHCRQDYNSGNKNTVIGVYNSNPVFLLQKQICRVHLFNEGLTCMLMLLLSWHIHDITFMHSFNKVHIYYRL